MTEDTSPLPTGYLVLDEILGGEGVPTGCLAEVFGDQGTGKSTLALELLQSVQSRDGQAAFLDVEHSLDVNYAQQLGVRPDDLLFSQPESGEETLDITEKLVDTGAIDLIVVDSVAALQPGNEHGQSLRGDSGSSQSQLLSAALRTLVPRVKRTDTLLLFTNQVRTRVNSSFGPEETTPGGNALKLYAAVRLRLERRSELSRGDSVIGHQIEVDIVKNRFAPPDRSTSLDLLFDRGFCPYGDLLDAGRKRGVIKRRSGEFRFGQIKLGTDRNTVRRRMEQDDELYRSLRTAVERAQTGEG